MCPLHLWRRSHSSLSHCCFNRKPIVRGSSKWDKKPLICAANSSVITSVSTDTISFHFLSKRTWLILTRNCNAGFPVVCLFLLPGPGALGRGNKTRVLNKITDVLQTFPEDKKKISRLVSCQALVFLSFALQ